MTMPAGFTVPAVADAVAAATGDRELIRQGDRRYTYADIADRSTRLARYLHTRGLGCHTERSSLQGHEVGQDLVGIYAYNGNEYVESMLGAWRARAGAVQCQLSLCQSPSSNTCSRTPVRPR